jgi:hypothetical protein
MLDFSCRVHRGTGRILQRIKQENSMRIFLIALPLLLASCATVTAYGKPLPTANAVPIGKAAYADGPIIRVIKILEDSRCPINARCIRAGDVRLAMEWLKPNGDKQAFEIRLSQPNPMADGQLVLVDVQPSRMAGGKALKVKDYRFSFRFDGGL